jgi:hypothetical protein
MARGLKMASRVDKNGLSKRDLPFHDAMLASAPGSIHQPNGLKNNVYLCTPCRESSSKFSLARRSQKRFAGGLLRPVQYGTDILSCGQCAQTPARVS